MNTLLKASLALVFAISTLPVFAQSPVDFVPSDVSFAVSLHPDHLNDKVNIREFQQMGFYQMLIEQVTMSAPSPEIGEEVANALADPTTIGINDLSDVYIFGKFTEEVDYYGFVIGLTNSGKFSDFLSSVIPPELEIETDNGYNYLQPDGEGAFAWNDRVLVIAGSNVKESWWDMPYEEEYDWEEGEDWEDWDDEEWEDWEEETELPTMEEGEPEDYEEIVDEEMVDEIIEEEFTFEDVEIVDEEMVDEIIEEEFIFEDEEMVEEEAPMVEELEIEEEPWDEEVYEDPYADYYAENEARESEETATWARSIISRSFGGNLKTNPRFAQTDSGDSDAFFWMDYEAMLSMMGGGNPYGSMGMISSVLGGMYDGMHYGMGVNFEDGQINMDVDVFGNQQMLDMWSAMGDSKYDKKLLSYINAEQILGYLSFNLNMEGFGEGMKDLMYPMIRDMSGMGEIAEAGLDVLGILIDDEALYNLFTGDAVLAVTGVGEFTETVITYEYDENFNATEVEREITDYFPEFTLMAAYGNEDHIDRIIRLIETSGLTQNLGAFYSMNIPDMPGEFYLAKEDGILFFTNDTELVTTNLESGFAKDRRLAKDHKKTLKKSTSAFYWNIPNTMAMASTFGLDNMSGPELGFFNMGRQNFESFSVTTLKKVDDASHSEVTIQLADEDVNAFQQIMEMINNMVMDMMDGDSRS
jgi:hypothetical protein